VGCTVGGFFAVGIGAGVASAADLGAAGMTPAGAELASITDPIADVVAPVAEPVAEDVAPVAEGSTPVLPDDASVVDPVAGQPTPVVGDTSPVVEDVVPIVEVAASPVWPAVDEVAPIVGPVVEQATAVVDPVADEVAPEVEVPASLPHDSSVAAVVVAPVGEAVALLVQADTSGDSGALPAPVTTIALPADVTARVPRTSSGPGFTDARSQAVSGTAGPQSHSLASPADSAEPDPASPDDPASLPGPQAPRPSVPGQPAVPTAPSGASQAGGVALLATLPGPSVQPALVNVLATAPVRTLEDGSNAEPSVSPA
jgi:hypothetical protein